MKAGDLVTPENVASLPVGAIVRWSRTDGPSCAIRVGPDRWEASGMSSDLPGTDEDVSVPRPATYIAYLPGVESAEGHEVTRA